MENKFLKKIIIILVILLTIICAIFLGVIIHTVNRLTLKNRQSENNSLNSKEFNEHTEETTYNNFDNIPNRITFAIYGVDKNEALADVIIVGIFNKLEGTINTISIPRDTYVKIPSERIEQLREKGQNAPSGGIKINAVHSYSGKYGNEYLTKQIEDLLDINIDYYFEINLKAFNEIVDAAGGIEIDVPQRMYYKDPVQGLTINLYPGKQTLTGKQAEGFVRFRQYVTGDIQRIEMQKLFLTEFFKQVFNPETVSENLIEYAVIFFKYVNTNMSLEDAIDYIPYIKTVDSSKITMETLPGDGHTPYNHYENETMILVNKLFYGIEYYDETESTTEIEEY